MKKSVLRALALCLTTAFATGYALAKDDKQSSQSSQSGTSSSSGSPGSSSSSSYSASSSSLSQTDKPMRLSKLMHQSIKGQSGEQLGTVHDIIAEPTSGQLQFVILSLSSSASGAPGASSSSGLGTGTSDSSAQGAPGTSSSTTPGTSRERFGATGTGTSGGNLVAVPWRLLQRSGTSGDQFTLNVDRTKLQSAPTFNASTWPSMDTSWSQQIYSHFGVESSTATGAPGSGTGTGVGNQSTPGVPPTPGTPDITPPSSGAPGNGSGSSDSGSGTSGSGSGSSGSGSSK